MGLFSTKTKHFVSSSVWNLAGDEDNRPDLLKSAIVTTSLSSTKKSIGEGIRNTLQSTSALRSRNFFRWARNNYVLGMPTGRVGERYVLEGEDLVAPLRAALALGSNQRLAILSACIDAADIEIWAEQWISEHHPTLTEDDWLVEFDVDTAKLKIIIGSVETLLDAPSDLIWLAGNRDNRLLYVSYKLLTGAANSLWAEGPQQLFTYRIGSGNAAFDALAPTSTLEPGEEFFPALPLRINNKSLTTMSDERQKGVGKAFKKLTGSKIDDVLSEIDEHKSVKDMDHVFVLPSVSLNTTQQCSLAYLYEFFSGLATAEGSRNFRAEYEAYLQKVVKEQAAQSRAKAQNAMISSNALAAVTNTATYSESSISYLTMAQNTIEITMPDLPEMRMRVSWYGIDETLHLGNAAQFSKKSQDPLGRGKFMSVMLDPLKVVSSGLTWQNNTTLISALNLDRTSQFALYKQVDDYSYRRIIVTGLTHQNYVYRGNNVKITAKEAMEDTDDSGFLVPLHYPTLKRMSQLRAGELSISSNHMVINCHVTQKVRWYQRGIFKVVLVVASIVLAVYTGGGSLATTAGLLGTNAAVGAMLGMTGVVGAIAGAAVNAIAGMILTTLITRASVALFGDKWGAVIGTIASFVGMQLGSQYFNGTGKLDLSSLMKPQNLVEVTKSVSSAYTQWLNADTTEIYEKITQMGEDYKDQISDIRDKAADILGVTNVVIDPMLITDASEHFGESSDTFLSRTLLTGSDLAELSLALIDNWAELSLELPEPL